MKTLALWLALLGLPWLAHAQDPVPVEGAIIESAEVTGLALDRLSAELRKDIAALAGARFNREQVDALAARIEAEHPNLVAAARTAPRPDGRVRVTLLVVPIDDDSGLTANINARYVVERVNVSGIDQSRLSQKLRDDLQALVGSRLDPKEADRLNDAIGAELPDTDVDHEISRGSEAGKILVEFHVTEHMRDWISVMSQQTKLIYHEDQGGSAVFDIQAGIGSSRFSAGFVFGNNDDLVEEYSGYWLRAGNQHVGTRRLGVSFEYASFSSDWQPVTLTSAQANPNIAEPYEQRRTAQPLVTFAFTPHVQLTGGASVSTLEALPPSPVGHDANAVVGKLGFDQTWRLGERIRQRVEASYELRAGTRSLASDLVYDRHSGRVQYLYEHGNTTVKAELLVGALTGRAPLFERFTLGDSSTLRGWNKYDIAPAGADRLVHQSLEFAYHHFAYFLDVGSVWDHGARADVRLSSGVGYHGDFGFLTLAVPLNANDMELKVMVGIRPGIHFGKD